MFESRNVARTCGDENPDNRRHDGQREYRSHAEQQDHFTKAQSDEASCSGTQGTPHGELVRASGASSKNQRDNVAACNQPDGKNGHEQKLHRPARPSADARIHWCDRGRDRSTYVGSRALQVNVGMQSPHHVPALEETGVVNGVGYDSISPEPIRSDRRPQLNVRRGKLKGRWHDSDHLKHPAIDVYGATDDLGTPAKRRTHKR